MFCSFSLIKCAPENREAYLTLRREMLDPGMASAPGFVKRELFISRDTPDEIYLLVYWESDEAAQAYRKGAVHESARQKAMTLLKGPLQTRDYDIVAD